MRRNFTLTISVLALAALSASLTASLTPDLLGLSPDSARTLLSGDTINLIVLEDTVFTDSIPEGYIAWQNPIPDSALTSSINVILAAPLTLTVPEIYGTPLFEAQALVHAGGLFFYPEGRVESEEFPAGTVAYVEPDPGTSAERGDTVIVKISQGKINYTYVTTSTGVDITLRDRPTFRILAAGTLSSDTVGFVLSFNLEAYNPYEHSMTVEGMRTDLQINRARIAEARPEMSVDISAGGKARSNIMLEVLYDDISRFSARAMLGSADFRLVGTYKLVVESGFSTKPFDAEAEFNLFPGSSDIRTRLEEIAGEQGSDTR